MVSAIAVFEGPVIKGTVKFIENGAIFAQNIHSRSQSFGKNKELVSLNKVFKRYLK